MTSYFAGRELWTPFLSFPLSLFGVSGIQDSTRGSLPTSKSFRGSLPCCVCGIRTVSTDACVRCSTITISGHEPREMLISRKISDELLFFAPLALCAGRKTFTPAISRRKCEINLWFYSTGGSSFYSQGLYPRLWISTENTKYSSCIYGYGVFFLLFVFFFFRLLSALPRFIAAIRSIWGMNFRLQIA